MITYETNYLAHHGILGMKWGVRRYQNKDGSLTPEGKRHNSNKDSDAVALSAATKYKALYNLQNSKEALNKRLLSNPKGAASSEEGKQYVIDYHATQLAFERTNNIINKMSKKGYKTIEYDFLTEKNTGEQYVRALLKDNLGNTHISEFYLGAYVDENKKD